MVVDKIIETLAKQDEIYQYLIDLSEKMQVAVKKNDIEEIDSLIKVEAALTMKFSVLEKNREKLVQQYLSEHSSDLQNYSITDLKKHLSQQDSERVAKLESTIKQRIERLQDINTVNSTLIKNRLDWINVSLKYLGALDDTTYDNKQQTKKSKLINELV